MRLWIAFDFLVPVFVSGQAPWRLNADGSTAIEAERPIQVTGREGLEKREVVSDPGFRPGDEPVVVALPTE